MHYTRCLAKELYEQGVRINAVSPGPTKTARFQATRVTDPDKMNSAKARSTAMPRPTIADAVGFPASPRAKFINGQGAARRWRTDAVPGLR